MLSSDAVDALDIGDDITLVMRAEPHALLGSAHAITRGGGGDVLTWMSVIDWARPVEIPTVAEPGKLPAGAGAAILNVLAERALAAGVSALRYAGPYPTSALWRALARSFRARGGDEAAFTRDVIARAARVARDPLDIDFLPAPHRRVTWPDGGDWSEVRDGVERVVVRGVGYERDGSPARLVRTDASCAAEVWFGDACYARVATVDMRGELVGRVQAPPALASRVIGQDFPPPLRAAIAELVAELVPAPLADASRARLARSELRWADLGERAARADASGFALHAALWERIAPHGLPRLALAIAEALAPVVSVAVIADVSHASVSA